MYGDQSGEFGYWGLKTRFCFNVLAIYLVKKLNHRTNDEMSNYLCASDILIVS